MEVTCERCGTGYAMDRGEDLEEPDDVGLDLAVVREKLEEARLRGDRSPGDIPMLGFAA